RIGHELLLVGADAVFANRRDIIDRRPEPDRLHDRGRAGFEAMRRIAIGDVILKYLADHLAAAGERGHRGKMLVLAIKDPDPGRPIQLVASADIEIAADILHVDIEMHSALRAID